MTSTSASGAAAAAAALAVFGVPELLESILLSLTVRDIWHARLVLKDFRDTIQGSSKLSRVLFMAPVGDRVAVWQPGDLHFGGSNPGSWGHTLFKPGQPFNFKINPFLRSYLSATSGHCLKFSPDKERFSRKHCQKLDSSWRDMLLTQPSRSYTRVKAPCKRMLELSTGPGKARTETGLTMADLVKLMERHRNFCDKCNYCEEPVWELFEGKEGALATLPEHYMSLSVATATELLERQD